MKNEQKKRAARITKYMERDGSYFFHKLQQPSMSFWNRLFGKATPPPVAAKNAGPPPAFPFPLVAVAGHDAIKAWKKHQALWRPDGCSAVMLGDEIEVKRIASMLEHTGDSPAAILENASRVNLTDYFAQRALECVEDGGQLEDGEWPEGKIPPGGLGAHLDVLSHLPKSTVFLGKIPTTKSWEILAHLRFGGWNDCPAPEHHVSILRSWSEKYGIELYSMIGDVVECTVERPPKTREEAMALAREQYFYCTDIVDQGTGSLALLGATLLNAPTWYFWWD